MVSQGWCFGFGSDWARRSHFGFAIWRSQELVPVLTGRKYSSSVARSRNTRIWARAMPLAFNVILFICNFQISTHTSHQQRLRSSTVEPTHKFPTHDQAHLTSNCKARHNPCQQKTLSPELSLLSRALQPHTGSRSTDCSFNHNSVNTTPLPRPSLGSI